MRFRFPTPLLVVFSLFLATVSGAPARAAESAPYLRTELEASYNQWRNAMKTRDIAAWKQATAAYRQAVTQNAVVSVKDPFPQAMFESPVEAPDISGLIFLDVLAGKNTAAAVYFGQVDFGIPAPDDIPQNLLVVHFLKDPGGWKYDRLRLVKIGDDADILLGIRNRDFSFMSHADFQPPAEAPQVPVTVLPPDLIAEMWVAAGGYDLTVTVNGQHTTEVRNDNARDLVIGGLKLGENHIKFEARPLALSASAKPEERRLEIAIYASSALNQPATRVFHYLPGEGLEADKTVTFETRFKGGQ